MIKKLFFDTDGLSAFLWVNRQSLLTSLYPNRIIIPKEVYGELSHPAIPHLKARIDKLISYNQASIKTIEVPSEEYTIFKKLTTSPDKGNLIIGKGEAACIALAKKNNGIIASNNLKDISQYIKEFNLENKTTGDILKEALDCSLITITQGEKIWQEMLNYRRKLGSSSFQEYLYNS